MPAEFVPGLDGPPARFFMGSVLNVCASNSIQKVLGHGRVPHAGASSHRVITVPLAVG